MPPDNTINYETGTAGARDVAAGGTGAVPVGSAPQTRKRRTSLASRGEPMVWLTGGCVAVAVTMIVVLLAFIAFNGFSTFWPQPVERVTYRDDAGDRRVLIGSQDRTQSFFYNEDADGDGELGPAEDVNDNAELDTRLAFDRTLYKTGNFTLTDTSYAWVDGNRVEDVERPEWAVLVEWSEKGNVYGTLSALTKGEERVEGSAAAWAKYPEWHEAALEAEEQIEALTEGELGEINDERAAMTDELDAIAYANRGAGGRESPEYLAEVEEQKPRRAELDERAREVAAEIAELEEERDQYGIEIAAAGGQIVSAGRGADGPIRLHQVVRVLPVNRMGPGEKIGAYVGRWWEFLAADPRNANSEGGVWPAIVGTVMLTFIMVILVVPVGVIAAIYLREYAKQGALVSLVRISVNNLAGVPSIVYGVFGLGFFCYTLGAWIDGGPRNIDAPQLSLAAWLGLLAGVALLVAGAVATGYAAGRMGKSDKVEADWKPKAVGFAAFGLWIAALALAVAVLATTPLFDGLYPAKTAAGSPTVGKSAMLWASLTLALLTLPVVIVATEEALSAVPDSMRQGSYACGASKWQTIRRIVLPRALPGIMTGMILAIARGAGEVAPLMLVGAVKSAPALPIDLNEAPFVGDGWFGVNRSFLHLGFHIYDLGFQSPDSEAARPLLYTTTLLLISIVVALNVAAILIRGRLRRAYAGGAF